MVTYLNMEQQISQTIFTNVTKDEFLASDRKLLGYKQRIIQLRPGAIILLQNRDTRAFFGVGKFGDFGRGQVFRKQCFLDTPDIYSGDNMKYNIYDIKLDSVVIFPKEFPFEDLRYLLDIDNNVVNNITKTDRLTFTRVFYKDNANEQKVIRKLRLWLKSIAPHLVT